VVPLCFFCPAGKTRPGRNISAMSIFLFLVFLAGIAAALEHHHRRTERLPHAPLGSDSLATWRDLDLEHVQHDLAARA
jgi:hypothetical protein